MTVLTVFMLMQMPGPRDIVIYWPDPWAFPVVQKPWGWAHILVQKPQGTRGDGNRSNWYLHNSPYMQDYCKRLFVLCSSEMVFSFLLKKSKLKAIEIEIAIFHPLGNLKGRTLDYFFYAWYIRHNFPYKLIPISMSYLKYFLSYQRKQYKCI